MLQKAALPLALRLWGLLILVLASWGISLGSSSAGISVSVFSTVRALVKTGNANSNVNFQVLRDVYKIKPPPEAFMTTPQLICYHGYEVEEHEVTTADGYRLTLFRIPHRKAEAQAEKTAGFRKGEPVIMIHGFAMSSDDWLLLPNPQDNLPYLLANNGHDVWLLNIRGNSYSMKPTASGLTSDEPKYYDFGFDEIALFDIPAVVQHVLKMSESSKVSFVGFSLGGGVVPFALSTLSEMEFGRFVRKISLLAPGMYQEHVRSPVYNLFFNQPPKLIQEFTRRFFRGRIFPKNLNNRLRNAAPYICTEGIAVELCKNILFLIGGNNPDQMSNKTASMAAGHIPSETSAKIIVQMQQLREAKKLQMFDYGPEENLKRYGTTFPPPYNLSRVQAPTQVFYGLGDLLVSPQDAFRSINELGNVVEAIQVAHPKWTHLDFIYGKDAKFFVYDKVVQFLSVESGS